MEKTKEKNNLEQITLKLKKHILMLRLITLLILTLILIYNKNVFASSPEINLKEGEVITKELMPDLSSYEVLSLSENGEEKSSVEQRFSNENYDITFKLEGAFGDKLVAEIKAKKAGKNAQEIKYYVYKKEGEPFTPYRSEFVVNVEGKNKENKEDSKEPNKSEETPKTNTENTAGKDKVVIPASEVKTNINKKLIKVYPQNVDYVALGNIYLREGNSVGANSLTLIPQGANIKSNGYTGDGWIRVEYNGQTGFVSSNYISVVKKSDLTAEMEKEAEKEKKEYEAELKKVGFVNSKGKTKNEQMKSLEKNIGSIPNVGKNITFKIFLSLSLIIFIALIFIFNFEKEKE